MDVVTLGMLIIDEIHFQPPREPELDVLGGAGSWAVVGARLFCEPPVSKRIGWTVHEGHDFPDRVKEEIDSWNTTCNFIKTPDRQTTRGWNGYGKDEERAFRYTTEKIRIDETQLNEPLLLSRCFHLICSPSRCISLVNRILEERSKLDFQGSNKAMRPLFVWEPVPDIMRPDALQDFYKAIKYVDIVSPNHQELAAVFGQAQMDFLTMEDQCSEIIDKGFQGRQGGVLVRCGERGCYIATSSCALQMPAYHQDKRYVADPTGAGNAFLGALCVGLLDKMPLSDASVYNGALYGTVAASFAVEQVGLPRLVVSNNQELWNGSSVRKRMNLFKDRTRQL